MVRYRQEERGRVAIFALAYLALVLVIVFTVIGVDASADFVNKGAQGGVEHFTFLLGAVVLFPVFLMLRFMRRPVEVDVGADTILIRPKNKPSITIALRTIDKLAFKGHPINGIHLYDASGKQLHVFMLQNEQAATDELLREILSRRPMTLKEETTIFGGKVMQKTYYAAHNIGLEK